MENGISIHTLLTYHIDVRTRYNLMIKSIKVNFTSNMILLTYVNIKCTVTVPYLVTFFLIIRKFSVFINPVRT